MVEAFDPAMGRGYRIGDLVDVPGASVTQCLSNYGHINRILRWKATLMVQDPEGNDSLRNGAGLRFTVLAKMENELIPRTCFVTVGDAQVIYAPGRSISIQAANPQAFELQAHYQLDEYAGGLSEWEDNQVFPALAAEADMALPNFCDSFEVFSPGATAPAPRLRGYGPGGTLVYDEVLAVPRSGEIPRIPGVDYTLSPSGGGGGGPQSHIILYNCVG
jgi:hypothetical protein